MFSHQQYHRRCFHVCLKRHVLYVSLSMVVYQDWKNGWHNSQVLIHTYLAQKITFTGCAWLCDVFILTPGCIYNMCMYRYYRISFFYMYKCNMFSNFFTSFKPESITVNVHGKDLNLVEAHELTLKKPGSCRTGLTGRLSLSQEFRICNSKGN